MRQPRRLDHAEDFSRQDATRFSEGLYRLSNSLSSQVRENVQ
jgi:hypothetical protein